MPEDTLGKSVQKCQARIKELRLKADKNHTAEQKLQSYIINYAEQFLNGKDVRIIGWEEILEGRIGTQCHCHVMERYRRRKLKL